MAKKKKKEKTVNKALEWLNNKITDERAKQQQAAPQAQPETEPEIKEIFEFENPFQEIKQEILTHASKAENEPYQPISNPQELKKFLKTFPARYKLFADTYLQTFNATRSYKAVSPDVTDATAATEGWRLLRYHKVQAYLSYIYLERQKSVNLSQKSIVNKLIEVYDKSMQQVPVFDKSGQPTGEYRFHAFGATKSIELAAKIGGLLDKKGLQLGDNTWLVKIYVVPAFKNKIDIPEVGKEDIKKLIEDYEKKTNV